MGAARAFGRCTGLFGSFKDNPLLEQQATDIWCPNLWRG